MKSPNPGSDGAKALGCICPVMDNNHGKRAPWPPDGWYMREDCPVHFPGEDADAGENTGADAA
jgi:hypothetical protein